MEELSYAEQDRRETAKLRAEEEQVQSRRRAAAEARRAAGVGFWRLVLIVALGILLSQAFTNLIALALRALRPD